MTLHRRYLGVDVAGEWIDVFDPSTDAVRRIDMTPRALREFARGAVGSLVVLDSAGGCEWPLMDALDAAGAEYVRVNSRHAREFARAIGRLAKTDRVDARVLAEMGRALELKPTQRPDPARRRMAALVGRRETLVASIVKEKQRLSRAHEPYVRRDIAQVVRSLKARLVLIEREIAGHLRAHAELHAIARRLRTAPGVGPVVAGVLIAGLPELGSIDRRAVASLAGLAPHADDSGKRRGHRSVWGGRAAVRCALYQAAFIASRCEPRYRAIREAMSAKDRPYKVIMIAIARKLLVALNAMIRDGRDFEAIPAKADPAKADPAKAIPAAA